MADENPDPHQSLPVRGRSSLPGGRHRRVGGGDLPPDAPPLILAIPGRDGEPPEVAQTIAALLRGAYSGIDVRLCGAHAVGRVLDTGPAVVVPLVTGAHPVVLNAIHQAVAGRPVVVTDPLGPHPMLASALHARLADAGLARADRIRQFSIGASVDGVIVATVGGMEAAREADVTAVLLAARLAVPVVAASLDSEPSMTGAVSRMKVAGATTVAIAPYVIGPEAGDDLLARVSAQAGAGCARPLGAHESVVRLIGMRYDLALDDVYAARQAP